MSASCYAPPALWAHFAACQRAGTFVPLSDELRAAECVIDGRTVAVVDLTPDDLERLATAERADIADETLARLDAIGGAA
jgi:hypothetical protein